MLYFFSAACNFLEKKATECAFYISMAPMAIFKVLASIWYRSTGSANMSVGAVVIATLSYSNARCCHGPQCHTIPFPSKSESGAAFYAKFLIYQL